MQLRDTKKVLVTGGGGFLGKSICSNLIKRGYQVTSFSRKAYTNLEEKGVVCYKGDICSKPLLESALRGCDAVIHTAAKAGLWGSRKDYLKINFEGTQNLLKCMSAQKVKYLIHTSSPSVVFDGKDIKGSDESIPYSKNFYCDYAYSKMLAEKYILEKAINGDLFALALRPHLIWGPGDPHFIPRIINKAKKNQLRKIGSHQNHVDVIYIENAATAHIDALEHLFNKKQLSGKAYFLGQERPVNLWNFINSLLKACGGVHINKRIPYSIAYSLAIISESIFKTLRLQTEPPITRFLTKQLSHSHFFDHSRAKRDFCYTPKITIEEGLKNVTKFYANKIKLIQSI
jgi:2-alkyl-3-oxoalkanoate reductase